MDLKDIHKSKTVRGIIIGLGVAILVLGIFELGVVAGYHKARFSEHLGENFNRNFIDPHGGGFFRDFSDKHLPPGDHGAVGKIVSITLPNIVVAGPDNLEKTVVVVSDTEVRKFREKITANDLVVGDSIVVLGSPNESGQIEAKLIRVLPPMPEKLPNNQTVQ